MIGIQEIEDPKPSPQGGVLLPAFNSAPNTVQDKGRAAVDNTQAMIPYTPTAAARAAADKTRSEGRLAYFKRTGLDPEALPRYQPPQ